MRRQSGAISYPIYGNTNMVSETACYAKTTLMAELYVVQGSIHKQPVGFALLTKEEISPEDVVASVGSRRIIKTT